MSPSVPHESKFPARWRIPSIFTPSDWAEDFFVFFNRGSGVIFSTTFESIFLTGTFFGTDFFTADVFVVGAFFVTIFSWAITGTDFITVFFGAGFFTAGDFCGADFFTAVAFVVGAFFGELFFGGVFVFIMWEILGKQFRKSKKIVHFILCILHFVL